MAEAQQVEQPVKPGYQTTEFWLSVATALAGFVYASGVVVDGSHLSQIMGLVTTVLATFGYSVSRGLAKS